jgi:hypothetical protein
VPNEMVQGGVPENVKDQLSRAESKAKDSLVPFYSLNNGLCILRQQPGVNAMYLMMWCLND